MSKRLSDRWRQLVNKLQHEAPENTGNPDHRLAGVVSSCLDCADDYDREHPPECAALDAAVIEAAEKWADHCERRQPLAHDEAVEFWDERARLKIELKDAVRRRRELVK